MMAHRPTRLAGWIALSALCIGLAPVATAGGPASELELPREVCAQATIHDIDLASAAGVDEIRVTVAGNSPLEGASEVVVDAGSSERIVRVQGDQSKTLQFSPALSARSFRISLAPVFAAERDACVTRIDLLANGQPVASVTP